MDISYKTKRRLQSIVNRINVIGLYQYVLEYLDFNKKSHGLVKLFSNIELHSILEQSSLYDCNLTIEENLFSIKNNNKIINKCNNIECNNNTNFISIKLGYNKYCSKSCQNKSPELRAIISKKQSVYQSSLSEDDRVNINNKTRATNLIKYGAEHQMQSREIQDKCKATLLKNHGVSHNFQIPEVRNKSIIAYCNLKKDELINELTKVNYKLIDYTDKLNLKIICDNNHEFIINRKFLKYRLNTINSSACPICNPINTDIESFIIKYIKSISDTEIIINTRTILKNQELDIYLPEYNLAFEVNGCYWHSELYKDKLYHINKTNECSALNIQLIHIWEDYILNKPDIIKSRILNLLNKSEKLFARKCIIREVSQSEASKFLDINHLQGSVRSNIRLGLYYNNELVSLMVFGPLRKSLGYNTVNNHFELLRFCNKLNTSVTGGASRLFSYFKNNYKPEHIISYASRDWSTGNLYEVLNFKPDGITKPGYYWIKNNIRYHRYSFRKSNLIKLGYDKSKSETELMYSMNYIKIWDSGNLRYIYNN